MNLNDIGAESLATSAAKGFGTISPRDWEQSACDDAEDAVQRYKIPTKLVLVHCEVSEAVEEFRKQHRLDHFGSELADVIIRIGQLGVGLGIDMDERVAAKLAANRDRPFQHGGRLI